MLLNVPGCWRCFPAIFSLARSLSPFPYATEVFFLPAFHFRRDSDFGRRSLGCFSNFFVQLEVLKRVSPSVTVGRGLAGVARTSMSFVIG